MTIKFRQQPASVSATFQQGFGRIADQQRLLGGTAAATIAARRVGEVALPVYSCDPQSLAPDREPSLTAVGWRYLIVEAHEIVETADILGGTGLAGGETPRFRGTRSGGLVVPQLGRALVVAEQHLGNTSLDFEMRLLECLPIQTVAVWLHCTTVGMGSDNDMFVIVAGPTSLGAPGDVRAAGPFWLTLGRVSRDVIQAHKALGGGGTPSSSGSSSSGTP